MPATGASTVYQRQAGTGAAVMFGQSSFDPVQLAKYSNALAAAKDKAKTDAKQKKLDDLYKGLSITAGKVLETDQNYLNGYEDQFMNWKAKTITGNPTTQDMQDGFRYKTEFDQHKASLQQHKGMLDPYMGLIKNGAKNLDTDAMMENAGKFTQPDMYVDSDPDIAETFTPIYEHFLEDPVYTPSGITKKQLIEMHKKAYRSFYLRPGYLLKSLLEIKNFDDIKRAYAGIRTIMSN